MDDKQIKLTKQLIEIDDEVIAKSVDLVAQLMDQNNTFDKYKVLVAPVAYLYKHYCGIRPLAKKISKISKQSNDVFKDMGYDCVTDEDHFKAYDAHAKKLRDAGHRGLSDDFKSNTKMFEAISNAVNELKNIPDNLGEKVRQKAVVPLMFKNRIKEYNTARNKHLTFKP